MTARFFTVLLSVFILLSLSPFAAHGQTHHNLQPKGGDAEVLLSGTRLAESPTEVTLFWFENYELLSGHFSGYAQWIDQSKGLLAHTTDYYLNAIALNNAHLRKKQIDRGCKRGFYRCVLKDEKIYLSFSVHKEREPYKVEHNMSPEEAGGG